MTSSTTSRLGTAPEEGCKAPCVTVATSNITLSGEQTVGVVAVVAGNRVLVTGQTDTTENGIYDAATTAWTRSTDWNKSNDVIGGMLIPSSETAELYQLRPFTGDYVAGTTAITFQLGIVDPSNKNFTTLAAATANTGLAAGNVVNNAEHTSGNGGEGTWDVIAGTGTANTYDKVVHDTLSLTLVLRVESEINVLKIGAEPSGTVDNQVLFDWAAANFDTVYAPNAQGQSYGFANPWQIYTKAGFTIRTDNAGRDDTYLFKALSAMEAVIQLLDGGATDPIITLPYLDKVSIQGDNKAVFGISFGKFGSTNNQLVKMVYGGSLSIEKCRFGINIGSASGVETDSAGYAFDNLVIEECTDGALLIDTGNGAAIRVGTATLNNNGFNPTTDSYNTSGEGSNAKVIGGELHIDSCSTAGAGAFQPATADIICRTGNIHIGNLWSDTHGLMLLEAGQATSASYIFGGRHHEGGMTHDITAIALGNPTVITINSSSHPFVVGTKLTPREIVGTTALNDNEYDVTAFTTTTISLDVNSGAMAAWVSAGIITSTPYSVEHSCKLNVSNTSLHGRFMSNAGQSGSLNVKQITPEPTGSTGGLSKMFEGELKTIHKGITIEDCLGNTSQKIYGGGTRDMVHEGFYTPQIVHIGAGSSGTSPVCVRQSLGPAPGDPGWTEYVSESDGRKDLFLNCVKDDASGNVIPQDNAQASVVVESGGTNGLVVKYKDFANDTAVQLSTFTEIFNLELDGSVDVTGHLTSGAATELTISSGSVTVTAWQHTLDTESDAASDDMVTFNGLRTGGVYVFRAESGARTIVIKNTGNVKTAGGADFSMTTAEDTWMGIYDEVTSKLLEVSRSANS